MLNTIKQFLFSLFIVYFSLFVSSCGSQYSSSELINATISGAAQKGPYVIGSSVLINQLTRDGQSTGSTSVTQTNDDLGNFSFHAETPGPVKIVVTGYHLNELTGSLSIGPLTLQAIYEVTRHDSQKAYVNILTHLIAERVLFLMSNNKMAVSLALDTAETELVAALTPILPTGDATNFANLNMYESADSNSGNAYLLALSAIVYECASAKATENDSGLDSELTSLLNTIASEFSSSGIVSDSFVINDLKSARSNVNPDEVKYNLEQRSQAVTGSKLDVPDMNLYLDTDGDGEVNNVDLDDDNDGIADLNDDEPYVAFNNTIPVANAGPDQNVSTGSDVTLDGSGSSDADEDMLSYSWSFTSVPEGSSAALLNTSTANPTFTVDLDGSYVIELLVNDGTENSVADSITVTAATANFAPVANAGPDQNVSTGSDVTLDGSGSSDADEDMLSYSWSFTSVPEGSSAALLNTSTVNPTFTADLDGSYVIDLVVNDGKDSSTDTVAITATAVTVGWEVPGLLEDDNTGGNSSSPRIAFDGSGNAIAVWTKEDGTREDIWAKRYTADFGWGTAELAETNDSGEATYPDIAFDHSGNAFVVWHVNAGGDNIYANRYTTAGGWETQTLIGYQPVSIGAHAPRLTTGVNGDVIAVWHQYDGTRNNVWANRYTVVSGWGTAELLETGTNDAYIGDVAIDSSGNAIAVWSQYDDTSAIWANRYIIGSGWGAAEPADNDIMPFGGDPRVVIDSNDNAIAVWTQHDGTELSLYANRYVFGSGWGSKELIETNNTGWVAGPRIVADNSGNAIAVWYQFDGTRNNIWANRYSAGSGWGTAELIENNDTGDAEYPEIAIDGSGNVIAVWQQHNGGSADVWANRYTAGSGWGTAEKIASCSASSTQPRIAVDAGGNAAAVWRDYDGTRFSVWVSIYREN